MVLPHLTCLLIFYHFWNKCSSYYHGLHDLVQSVHAYAKSLSLSWTLPTLSFTTVQSHFFFFNISGIYLALAYLRAFACSQPEIPGVYKGLALFFSQYASTQSCHLENTFSNHLIWSGQPSSVICLVSHLFGIHRLTLQLFMYLFTVNCFFFLTLAGQDFSKLIIIIFHSTRHVESLINTIARKKDRAKRKKNDST